MVLDDKRYMTRAGSWRTQTLKPSTVRYTLAGTLDATYGPAAPYEWIGDIIAPVVAQGAVWGTIEDLRTSLAKVQSLSYVDHYGDVYTVHAMGPFIEDSLSPMWDGESNEFRVSARLIKV